MRFRQVLVAGAVVSAAAAGCSGGGHRAASNSPPTAAPVATTAPAPATTVVDRMAAFCGALQAVSNDLKVSSQASDAQKASDAQALHATATAEGGQVASTSAQLGSDSRASSAGDQNATLAALHDLDQLRSDCAGAGHPIG